MGSEDSALHSLHYGEGAYAETELEIQELLGRVAASRWRRCAPRRRPDALIVPQTEDQPGAYSGPYEAGGVWAVVEGVGCAAASTARRSRSPSRAASS